MRIEMPSSLSSSLAYCVGGRISCGKGQLRLGSASSSAPTHLDKNIPVAVIVKDIRVHDLKLADIATAVVGLADQRLVGVLALRVLVEHLHVRMRGRRVEVPVLLLDVLAVVACFATILNQRPPDRGPRRNERAGSPW